MDPHLHVANNEWPTWDGMTSHSFIHFGVISIHSSVDRSTLLKASNECHFPTMPCFRSGCTLQAGSRRLAEDIHVVKARPAAAANSVIYNAGPPRRDHD